MTAKPAISESLPLAQRADGTPSGPPSEQRLDEVATLLRLGYHGAG